MTRLKKSDLPLPDGLKIGAFAAAYTLFVSPFVAEKIAAELFKPPTPPTGVVPLAAAVWLVGVLGLDPKPPRPPNPPIPPVPPNAPKPTPVEGGPKAEDVVAADGDDLPPPGAEEEPGAPTPIGDLDGDGGATGSFLELS